jgi:hypothetical protein
MMITPHYSHITTCLIVHPARQVTDSTVVLCCDLKCWPRARNSVKLGLTEDLLVSFGKTRMAADADGRIPFWHVS